MNLSVEKTVRELALEIPNATRVFEKLGIDYCCGGTKSLAQACSAANISIEQAVASLGDASVPLTREAQRWQDGSLAELIDHIVSTHHKYTREELVRLQALLGKVCSVHGENHRELLELRQVFQALDRELTLHLMKEEKILFPYIVRTEEAIEQEDPVLPAPFGKVENPVRAMMQEHDSAGIALRKIRELSSNYSLPPDACFSYRTLYRALEDFETDLHQHIHLENNILFPGALNLKSR